jgi:hypothetical protein
MADGRWNMEGRTGERNGTQTRLPLEKIAVGQVTLIDYDLHRFFDLIGWFENV